MNTLIDAINASAWADRTKKNRISFIKTLKQELAPDTKDYNFLKNFNLTSKYILDSTTNPTTRKSKILTVKALLHLVNDPAAAKYDKLGSTLIDASEEFKGNNVVKDSNKWITYDEMLEIPYIIGSSIKYIYGDIFLDYDDIDKLNSLAAKHKYLRMLTEYIISILYCWQAPVRADYALVLLKPSKTSNWYDVNKGVIHWNDFKNIKSMGAQSWLISKEIKDELNNYISILKYIIDEPKRLLYLVGNRDAKEFTRESFATTFNRIMKHYTKKNITINTMRHVYETHIITSPHYNKLTINEQNALHEKLLHRASTARSYVKIEQ